MKVLTFHFARKLGLKLVAVLLFCMFIFGQSFGQTAGILSFTVNPVSYTTSTYTNRHFVAAWIEDSTSSFIKTRNRYGSAGNCSSHLVNWKAASPSQSVVDATTAATLTSYAPLTFTWAANDLTGTAPYNLLPDGNYTIWIEYAWDDASTAEDTISVQFTKGPTAVSFSPADAPNFTGMTLTWTPAAQISVTTSSLASNNQYIGALVNVPFTIGTGTIYNNNVWTAQLSDENGSFANPDNIGTLVSTTAGTISAIIPPWAVAGIDYRIRVVGSQPYSVGTDNGSSITLDIPLPSPTLTVATNVTVDNPVDITFTDNVSWRAAITSVRVGGVALTPFVDYDISPGIIELLPSGLNTLLTTAGSKAITIMATGYTTVSLTQIIGVGNPAKLAVKTQPKSPITNGALLGTQPEIFIQDQYGNITTSTATINATVGYGSWTLGGNATAIASSGIASFTNISATSVICVMNATITFISPGLASVTSNGFNVPFPLSGNYTIGATGDFTSFTKSDGLFATINASGISGNVSISVNSNITDENGATSLSEWVEYGGSGYTLTIQPSGGVVRTVSGTVAGSPLFNLNGADRVTINGLNTGGNALILSNLSTSATANTSTIQYIGDATNNTITNCSILGSATVPLATNGGNIVFATGISTGNDNNTISNCKIGPAGTNLPSIGILGNGSTTSSTIANSNITVTNCEIFDYYLTGGCGAFYVLTGNTDWNITNNKIYQTASRSITAGMYGIYFSNSTFGNNIQITGNTIGYANNASNGTYTLTSSGSFQGIYMVASSTAATTSNINNNIIANISLTSSSSTGAFTGIYHYSSASSNTVNINNNIIKNIALLTSTSTETGIYAGSATNLYCNYNTIDGISRNAAGIFYGIRYNQPTNVTFMGDTIRNFSSTVSGSTSAIYGLYSNATATNENLIGNCIYNFTSTATGAQTIYGWYNSTTSGTKVVRNNSFYNFTAAAGSAVIYGFRLANGATDEISGNLIYGLSGGISIYGMRIDAGTTNSIFKNKIFNLYTTNSSSSTVVYGMYINGGTTNNIYNNIIGDLRATAASATNPIAGFYISGGTTDNLYFNTVYLNATSSGTNFGSSALYASTTPTVNLKNNLFINGSTAKGTGYVSAYRRSSTTLTTYATTSNNNVFYAGTPGTYYLLMYDGTNSYQTLATFKTAVGPTRDAGSFSINPTWVSTTSSDANYLHINTTIATTIESGAAPISGYTTDFDGDTRNTTTPDIGADEFTGVLLDMTPPVITYTPLGNQLANATVVLTATITDLSNVPKIGTGMPILYYKVNSGSYTPVSATYIGANQFTFTFAPTTATNDIVSYYIVAQDSNVSKNIIAYPYVGASGYTTNPPACSTPPTTPSTFTTAGVFSGTFNVGTSQTYASLTGAGGLFAALNNSFLSGNITVNITSDITETGTNALNQWPEIGVGGYTLTIQPSGGATRIVSGTVAGPMININGADRVTIDGLNTAGNALILSNLSTAATAGTSTIQFVGDASNNTITNCTILGSATVPLATTGGNIFISTGNTTGNDNITISNCKIGPAGTNLPSKGITASGSTTSAAIANSNITINNCEIFDFFLTSGCAGIYALTGNTDWNITNNKLYQTATRTFTATGTMNGIYFANSTYGDNIQITGNTVGFANNNASGTFTLAGSTIAGAFQGIYLTAMSTAATTCNINNNIISDISLNSSSGTFTGIYNGSSASSNTININNNNLENIVLTTTTGTVQGIYAGSATNLYCNQNFVDDFTRNAAGTTYGIQYNAPTNVTFNGNTISDFLSTSTTSTSAMYAVYTGNGATNENLIGNIIYNFTSSSTASQTIIGYYNNTGSSSGTKIVQNNNIYNLSAAGGATIYGLRLRYGTTVEVSNNTVYSLSGGLVIYGMYIYPSATVDNIFKNKIYDLSSNNSSSSTQVYGLYINGGTTNNIYNNLIGDLRTTAANAANPLVGMYINGGTTNNVYYNTIYLNASSTGALFGSSAIYASTTPIVNLRNNIFVNKSIANAAGLTAVYRRSATTLTSYATTSNNNLFYAGNPSVNNIIMTDGANSYQTLASFQTAVSTRETYSISENPNFISILGADANFLHINTFITTSINNGAINIAGYTDDFDGNIRQDNPGYIGNGNAPDMGADEFEIVSCTPPTAQPTALILTPANTSISGTFTASPNTDYYLIVKNTTATIPNDPINGTLYSSSNQLTGSTFVAYQAGTSISDTGLISNTHYYYFIYAVNATSCAYGPAYLAVNPLTADAITTSPSSKVLNVTAMLQAYYDFNYNTELMLQTQDADENGNWNKFSNLIVDTLTVQIRSALAPDYLIVQEFPASSINVDGTISLSGTLPATITGENYIVIKHRNSIETWSEIVDFTSMTVNYNFYTSSISTQFGGNQSPFYINSVYKGSLIWAGDLIQDGSINIFDLADSFDMMNDPNAPVGYVTEDVNGDGTINIYDLSIVFDNMNFGVGSINPFTLKKK